MSSHGLWYWLESDREWLLTATVGTTVIVLSGHGKTDHVIATVTHSTPTQVTVNTVKYWRKTGFELGHSIYNVYLVWQPTPERLADIEVEKIERLDQIEVADCESRLRRCYWRNVPLAKLRAIIAILDQA